MNRIARPALVLLSGLSVLAALASSASSSPVSSAATWTAGAGAGAASPGGEVFVKFRPRVSEIVMERTHRHAGAAARYHSRRTGWVAVEAPVGSDPRALVSFYERQPAVERAQLVRRRRIAVIPNDLRPDQWAYRNTGQTVAGVTGAAGADIDAAGAWDLTIGSKSVVVAVLDTGVDLTRGDLSSRLVPGFDFVNTDTAANDDQGHGTAVASVIGAIGNNDTGMTGLNWKVSIMPLKVCDAAGGCDESAVLAAIDFAVDHGAHVINMSLSCDEHEDPVSFNCTASLPGSCLSQPEEDAIAAAGAAGVVVVDAAGNCGNSNDDATSAYPCGYDLDNNICAGSTDNTDNVSSFSNWGPGTVDIGAPGELILLYDRTPPGGFLLADGTSFSSPMVAGVAALLRSRTTMTPAAIRERIVSGGEPGVSTLVPFSYLGGRLDALNTVKDVFEAGINYSVLPKGDVNLLADVTGDGRDDLIRAISGTGIVVSRSIKKPHLKGPATWSLTPPPAIVLAGDVTGDGLADVVYLDAFGPRVHRSQGNLFASIEMWGAQAPGTLNFVADVDGDGLDDLVRFNGTFEAMLSTGSMAAGGFAAPQTWSNAAPGTYTAIADVDGNGRADLVTWANGATTQIEVGTSNGASFDAPALWLDTSLLQLAAAADVDGDGKADLVGLDPATDCLSVMASTGTAFTAPRTWTCTGTKDLILAGRAGRTLDARADLLTHSSSAGWEMHQSVK